MNRLSPFLLFLFLGVFLLPSPSLSKETEKKNHFLKVYSAPILPSDWNGEGFRPFSIKITNDTDIPRSCTISCSIENYRLNSAPVSPLENIRITLKPGQISEQIYYVPPLGPGRFYGTASIHISEEAENNEARLYISLNNSSNNLELIATKGVNDSFCDGNIISSTHYFHPEKLDLDSLPADERIFSSISTILTTLSEYEKLGKAHKEALRKWMLKGGRLFIFGQEKELSPRKEGDGWLIPILKNATPSDFKEQLSQFTPKSIEENLDLPTGWEQYDIDSPPIFLFLSLLAFAVAVGPLSLFVWAPAGKRHRLFLLIPSLSLGFSIFIATSIILSEGFGGKGARKVRIHLDPESNSAVTVQTQICKTGVLTGTSFPLDKTTEFYSLKKKKDKHSSGWVSPMPDFRTGNTGGKGWFSSKSTIANHLKATLPTRARVSVIGVENGTPLVQSTVPSILTNFSYIDPMGGYWTAAAVPPGQKTRLEPVSLLNDKVELNAGEFRATGSNSELGPIDTLSSIDWESDSVTFDGPVVNSSILRESQELVPTVRAIEVKSSTPKSAMP